METLGGSSTGTSYSTGHWETTNGWASYSTKTTGTEVSSRSGWSLSRSIIPGFHRKKREGKLLGYGWYNHYQYQYESPSVTLLLTRISNPLNQCKFIIGGDFAAMDSILGGDVLRDAANSADVRPAVQQAVASLSSKQFDLGVFAGELRQNMLMFASLANRAANIIAVTRVAQDEIQRQRRTIIRYPSKQLRVKRKVRSYTGRYLAAEFGWIPLYRDIQSFIESANIESRKTRYFSTGTGNGFNVPRTFSASGTFHTGSSSATGESSLSVSVRGRAAADIVLPRFRVNPLEVAWEVIPYSFVADWFFTVGRALVAASNTLASRQLASCGSILVSGSGAISTNWIGNSSYSGGASRTMTGSAELKLRFPMSPPFYPVPRIRVGYQQVVDALALLGQAMVKRR